MLLVWRSSAPRAWKLPDSLPARQSGQLLMTRTHVERAEFLVKVVTRHYCLQYASNRITPPNPFPEELTLPPLAVALKVAQQRRARRLFVLGGAPKYRQEILSAEYCVSQEEHA